MTLPPHRLLLSGRLGSDVADELAAHLPRISVRAREQPTVEDAAWADAFSGFAWPKTLGAASLDWVHCMGAGVDGFLEHSGNIGTLTRTVGRMPERLGRFVLALILDHMHHLTEYAEDQRRRDWRPMEALPLPERAVVLGTGATASGIAHALSRNGLHVVGVNRSGVAPPGFAQVHPWEQKERALQGCDVLVAALPGLPSTAGIVDHQVFGPLRSAHFVNVGRGSTVDHAALRRALDDDTVSHADLDVFRVEPPSLASWLWTHPAIRVTPHVGALTTVKEVVEAIVATWHDLSLGVRPGMSVDQRRLG